MSEVMCPKGCGEMEIQTCGDGRHWAACDVCQMEGPSAATPEAAMEEAGRLCYREVRERLPTEAEEAAHLARWGEGAGFMLRSVDILTVSPYRSPTWVTAGRSPALSMLRGMVDRGVYSLECWSATAKGRPVAWPRVDP